MGAGVLSSFIPDASGKHPVKTSCFCVVNDPKTDAEWEEIWIILSMFQGLEDEFLKKDIIKLTQFRLDRYLLKAVSIVQDVWNLMKAAHLLNLRNVFTSQFQN